MSGATVHQLRVSVMKPVPAKTEDDVPARVETWKEQLTHLLTIDTKEPLPESYQVAALRMILIGKVKEHIDSKYLDPTVEPKLAEILSEVRQYTGARRAEMKASSSDTCRRLQMACSTVSVWNKKA